MAIAKAKADELLKSRKLEEMGTSCVVICCDQVVHHKGVIREKPESSEQCREFLQSYVDTPAMTVGAVVVTHYPSGIQCAVTSYMI